MYTNIFQYKQYDHNNISTTTSSYDQNAYSAESSIQEEHLISTFY